MKIYLQVDGNNSFYLRNEMFYEKNDHEELIDVLKSDDLDAFYELEVYRYYDSYVDLYSEDGGCPVRGNYYDEDTDPGYEAFKHKGVKKIDALIFTAAMFGAINIVEYLCELGYHSDVSEIRDENNPVIDNISNFINDPSIGLDILYLCVKYDIPIYHTSNLDSILKDPAYSHSPGAVTYMLKYINLDEILHYTISTPIEVLIDIAFVVYNQPHISHGDDALELYAIVLRDGLYNPQLPSSFVEKLYNIVIKYPEIIKDIDLDINEINNYLLKFGGPKMPRLLSNKTIKDTLVLTE